MNRRGIWRLAMAGTAAAALAAGAWLQQRKSAAPAQGDGADAAKAPADATAAGQPPANAASGTATTEQGLWQLRFDKPDGGELAMSSLRGQPLLVNFWGTWCPPCVAEMPELDRFAREMAPAGWRVLGLAVDNPKAVREYLTTRPVGYTIALAGFEGASLSRQLGNDKGGLPYTVAFNAAGVAVHQKAGQTTLAELQGWARNM